MKKNIEKILRSIFAYRGRSDPEYEIPDGIPIELIYKVISEPRNYFGYIKQCYGVTKPICFTCFYRCAY